MGYWATSLQGDSLQVFGDLNPDGSEMVWGDSPADALSAGMSQLIQRMQRNLGRAPTINEIDAVKTTAAEMVEAITEATEIFTADIGRPPTSGEITAGLAFADSEIALESHTDE
jgi:hypothetical protein